MVNSKSPSTAFAIIYVLLISLITWGLFEVLVTANYVRIVWQVMHLLNIQTAYEEIPVVIVVPGAVACVCAALGTAIVAFCARGHLNSAPRKIAVWVSSCRT
jgi:hypothetical protein